MDVLKDWLGLAALFISVGGFLWTQMTSDAKRALKALDDYRRDNEAALTKMKADSALSLREIDEHVALHEGRLQAVEGELRHLPDKDAVHRLELTLKDMAVEIAKIGASAEQSTRISARVEEFLLRGPK